MVGIVGSNVIKDAQGTRQSSGQSMYIFNDGFAIPVSTVTPPAPTGTSTDGQPYDTETTTTQGADGSITIGTNAPPLDPSDVTVVGMPTLTPNPDGSLTLVTTYSDGTVVITTFFDPTAAGAALNSEAAAAAAQGDTAVQQALQADAVAANTAAQGAASDAAYEQAIQNMAAEQAAADSNGTDSGCTDSSCNTDTPGGGGGGGGSNPCAPGTM
jgi:hypothetical protein